MWYILFLMLGLLSVGVEVVLVSAWVFARFGYSIKQKPCYTPKTCVIVPCKDVDKYFIENMDAICSQNYEKYRVIFVTDSTKDPAYKSLQNLYSKNPKISIVVSDFIDGCSGKIAALLTGIQYSQDAEVYVFADSDIKPHRNWLSDLVAHLYYDDVGVTTGYRWFFASSFSSLFVSCWNMVNSLSLFFNAYNFAWGGSMAIKKDLFDALNVGEEWKKGFSDDLILTRIVKDAGFSIRFLPACISESPVEGNITSFVTWGTRQLTWMRWYFPSYWIFSIVGAVALKTATISGFLLVGFGFILPGLLMISTIFFEMLSGALAHSTFRKKMKYPHDAFGHFLSYALLMPVVFFVIAYNDIVSIFKNEITWGGRVYQKPKKK